MCRSTVCPWKSGTVCEVRSVNAVQRVPVYSSRKKKMELNIIKRFREVRVWWKLEEWSGTRTANDSAARYYTSIHQKD